MALPSPSAMERHFKVFDEKRSLKPFCFCIWRSASPPFLLWRPLQGKRTVMVVRFLFLCSNQSDRRPLKWLSRSSCPHTCMWMSGFPLLIPSPLYMYVDLWSPSAHSLPVTYGCGIHQTVYGGRRRAPDGENALCSQIRTAVLAGHFSDGMYSPA